MIPKLFSGDATSFVSEGLGRFTEAISCKVVEERNGRFELEMVYPVTGHLFRMTETNMIVVANANDLNLLQAFRIYKITTPFNGKVTIYAQHISYDLTGIPVGALYATGIQDALARLISQSLIANPFTITTDITNPTSVFTVFPIKSFRECLGGSEGSLLDVFGGRGTGEFKWDNFEIQFLEHRGTDRGVSIEFGKNMTNLVKETNIETLRTGVMAYWFNTEATVYSDIQYVTGYASYPVQNVLLIDCTSDFETTPTVAQLNAKAIAYRDNNEVGVPKSTLKVSFAPLEEFAGGGSLAQIERVLLCDTVTVHYSRYNIDVQMKVIETDYNVLMARYNSITLGNAKSNLASTIQQQIDSSIQKSKTKEAIFYLADNQINIAADVVGKYGNNTFNMVDNGLMRPFIKAGPGTSFDLASLDRLDTGTNTVLVITSHNSTSACNTMWIVRRSSGNCFQIGGATGTVTVTCSGNTIHVASSGGNVNAYYVCLDGAN